MPRRRPGLAAAASRTLGGERTIAALVERVVAEAGSTGQDEREVWVELERIEPAPWQPRLDYGADEISALADDIRRNGLLQALLARPHPDDPSGNRLQLLFGHRRLVALKLLAAEKDTKAPYRVRVRIRHCSDLEARLLTSAENAHRKNLSAWELARDIAGVRAALREAGLPHTDRDLEPIFGLRAGPIAEYRIIGERISEEALRQAGLTRADDGRRIDWQLVSSLDKSVLLKAARAGTDAERVDVLRAERMVARPDATPQCREEIRPDAGSRDAEKSVRVERAGQASGEGPARFSCAGLREKGRFAIKLSSPFKTYTAGQSRNFLRNLLPAVAALAENLPADEHVLEHVGPGILLYIRRAPEHMESLGEIEAARRAALDLLRSLDAARERCRRGEPARCTEQERGSGEGGSEGP